MFYIIGCSDDSNTLSYYDKTSFRKIAYESLSEESKPSLAGDWRSADVSQGKYQRGVYGHRIFIDAERRFSFHLDDPDFELFDNQKLVAVSFRTINMITGGPIIKIIDYKFIKVIGFVPILG